MAITDFFLGKENMDKLAEIEGQYMSEFPGMITDAGASGVFSDARHAAATSLMSDRLGGGVIGDTLANIGGFAREVPTLVSETLGLTPRGQSFEDIKANAAAFSYPTGTSVADIYADVFSKAQAAQAATKPGTGMGYNYGQAQANPATAGGIVDVAAVQDAISRARAQDFIDARAEVKNATPATFGLANPADRFGLGRAATGPAVEMIGGQAVPVGDVLGRQMALEKADFFEEPESRFGLGEFLSAIALKTQQPAFQLASMIANRDKIGRGIDRVKSGLGSLGSKFAGKMRGINPITGRPNTQAQYEAARTARQQQKRTDRMIDRISKGKKTRSNPRDAGTTAKQKADISAAIQDAARTGQYGNKGGSGSGGRSKIVCTMMNDSYGFGNFRNKIWLKHSRDLPKEYEVGYHTIFLPLVKFAKGKGKLNRVVKKTLEHIARHRTYDLKQEMKGKIHLLGRAYRKVLEPLCFITGKIKSALGRG